VATGKDSSEAPTGINKRVLTGHDTLFTFLVQREQADLDVPMNEFGGRENWQPRPRHEQATLVRVVIEPQVHPGRNLHSAQTGAT